jgi:hypothetical protein
MIQTQSTKKEKQRGIVLASLMISTIVVFAIVLIAAQTVVDNYKVVTGEQYRVNAQFAADAGIDYAITQLNNDQDWAGQTEATLVEIDGKHRTTYEIEVRNSSDDPTLPEDHLLLAVTGRTYFPETSTTPKETKTILAELYSVSGGNFGGSSVVTGVGGLILTNSAKIVAGNVFVNGEISMTNSAQIGTSQNPVNVRTAHQNCPVPPNSQYPRVCGANENGQPISMTNTSRIYGNVQATNQTDGSRMQDPGLVPGNPEAAALPAHDRAAQIASATNIVSPSSASCYNGTKNIPANTRINGNVNWSNSCRVVINGNVYVTGNINISNSVQVTVSETAGAVRPQIMVDGSSGFRMSNNTAIVANSFDTGVDVIAYHSSASCSPNCSEVTGSDLYNSRNLATIELNNNASAPETLFYARWSQVNIVNSGDIGALVGQTVRLNNSATVTFGASVEGVGSLPPTWLVYSYRQN